MISQNCGNSVIFLQAFSFRHEFAEGLFLFVFQKGERIKDIGEFIPGQAVEMGDVGVDLCPQLGTIARIPAVHSAVINAAGGRPLRRQLWGMGDILYSSCQEKN